MVFCANSKNKTELKLNSNKKVDLFWSLLCNKEEGGKNRRVQNVEHIYHYVFSCMRFFFCLDIIVIVSIIFHDVKTVLHKTKNEDADWRHFRGKCSSKQQQNVILVLSIHLLSFVYIFFGALSLSLSLSAFSQFLENYQVYTVLCIAFSYLLLFEIVMHSLGFTQKFFILFVRIDVVRSFVRTIYMRLFFWRYCLFAYAYAFCFGIHPDNIIVLFEPIRQCSLMNYVIYYTRNI